MSFTFKKHFTLVLIPHDHAFVRHLKVSHKTVYSILAGAGGVLVLILLLTQGYISQIANSARLAALERENSALRSRVSDFQKQVTGLREEMSSLSDIDAKMRLLADLEQVDPDVRKVGIGGPEPNRTPGLGSSVEAIGEDIDQVTREAKLTRESFSQIVTKLQQRKDLWDRIPSIQPVSGLALHDFGYRQDPFTGLRSFHAGQDILAPRGTPIVAAADGIVTYAGARGGYGLCVEIDHGFGYETRYGHCSYLKARTGEKVKRGQIIGLVGSTGRTTGPHLHYEVMVSGTTVSPASYILSGQCFD